MEKLTTYQCRGCGDIQDYGDPVQWQKLHADHDGLVWHEECPAGSYVESLYVEVVEGQRQQLYVNLYDVYRSYGGPEEGGWYYDSGEPIASIPIPGVNTRVNNYQNLVVRAVPDQAALELAETILKMNGWDWKEKGTTLVLRIEDHPAEHFPKVRPHYE